MKGKPGEPVLISWDDAETLFHEFGHALHGLSLERALPVARRHQRGARLRRVPVAAPRALAVDARGARTASPCTTRPASRCPRELVAKIEKAATFNQGFATVEYLASALVDMKLHLAGDAGTIDPDAFERETLAALGMPTEIVMRHRTPQFAHIFSSDGYSAGYYSYLWADTLTADAWEAFAEAGGPYDKAVAQAAARARLLGRQHRRPGRGLPRLPRPRRRHRRADAQARLPGAGPGGAAETK